MITTPQFTDYPPHMTDLVAIAESLSALTVDAPPVPVQSAGPEVVTAAPLILDSKMAGKVTQVAKMAIYLGQVERVENFAEAWEADCPAPFTGHEPKWNGKPYMTVASITARAAGYKPPIPVGATTTQMGAAVLESLCRVLIGCGPKTNNIAGLAAEVMGDLTPLMLGCTTSSDREIVMLLIAMQGRRVQAEVPSARYMDYHTRVVAVLNSFPEIKEKIAGWGQQLGQLFVDFFRSLGEMAVIHSWGKASIPATWNKAISLNEELAHSFIRMMGFHYPKYTLSEETMKDIWDRTTKE